MPSLTPFGFLPSIMLKALLHAFQAGTKRDIEHYYARRCYRILDNGGAHHLGFQGNWRPHRWYGAVPCHRRFPQGVRSILTGVACERLCILRHLLLGVCNTCRFEQDYGCWDSCDGACEGPPTTVLATIGALVGAGTRAATWCVSWRCLVTDGGTKALLTIVCACFLPFPFPPLCSLLGAP